MDFAMKFFRNKKRKIMNEEKIETEFTEQPEDTELNAENSNVEEPEATPEEETAEQAEEAAAEEKDPLEAAQEEIAQLKEQMLYKAAEFDNYRKRTIKEKAELLLNGAEKTVVAILPVIDDMERAIAEGQKTDDPVVLREGMELIFQKFQKVLEGLGVKKIETEKQDFNVDVHEAIAMVPGMGDENKGKVIRHAKVAVGQ